jgi:HEAT repeat protein
MKRYIMALAAAAVAVLLTPGPFAHGQSRELVDALQGPDESRRVEALQRLPHEGAPVAPLLVPLLAHEDAKTAKAAADALWMIANEVSRPGMEAERRTIMEALTPAIDSNRPDHVRRTALRILAVVTPPGADVPPIAELLDDAAWREPARTTLERIGTPEACAALRNGLRNADADFAIALMRSLAAIEDPASVDALSAMAAHEHDAVRAAAASALAWTGDPALASTLREVWRRADADTRFEAADALLRYADAMARQGGNWQLAMNLYTALLAGETNGVLRGAAILALARHGDASAVPLISEAAAGGPEAFRGSAFQALAEVDGQEASQALAQVYNEAPGELRPDLLHAFGVRGDPLLLPVMVQTLEGGDVELQTAAATALAISGLPEAIPHLVAHAESPSSPIHDIAQDAAFQLAESLSSHSGRSALGNAFAQLLPLARDADERALLLSGIARNPAAEAYNAVAAAAAAPEAGREASGALLAVAGSLLASGDSESALAAYERVAELGAAGQDLTAVASGLQALGAEGEIARRLGFVTTWRLAGPFEWNDGAGWDEPYVGEPEIDLNATYATPSGEVTWQRHTTANPMGKVDLRAEVSARDLCVAYAYTEIAVDAGQDAVLRLGVDDGEKIWVNGELVFNKHTPRPMRVDEDIVPARLKQGVNRILLKISQHTLGWEFCMRVTDARGRIIGFEEALP